MVRDATTQKLLIAAVGAEDLVPPSHMTVSTFGLDSELVHILEDGLSTFKSECTEAGNPHISSLFHAFKPTLIPATRIQTCQRSLPHLRFQNKMCNYLSLESPCGHRTLLAGSNCYLIYAQLQRINNPAYHSHVSLPFDIPPGCMPNRRNVQRRSTAEFCGLECRNNALYGERCGTRDARYGPGSARIGVGWRY
ncbi:hypothetical protein VTL71DRAFT_485 [Oculimacula yallundae]|uniref:Uncharacterized protein n=1 Tax=Oculimacula yallundae TaxID=86028 RepID=A0ABR4D149_9HELO